MANKPGVIPYIINTILKHKWYVLLMIFTATSVASEPVIIYLMKSLVDYAAAGNAITLSSWPILCLIIFEVMLFVQYRLDGYFITAKFDSNIRKSASQYAIDNLIDKSYKFFTEHMIGNLSNKVENFASTIGKIMEIIFEELLPKFMFLLVSVYVVSQSSTKLGIIMLLWVISFLTFSLLISKKINFMASDIYSKISMMIGKVVDIFGNILSVKIFKNENHEKRLMEKELEKIRQADFQLRYFYFIVFTYYGISYLLIQFYSIYILVDGYKSGVCTITDFVNVIPVNTIVASRFWEVAIDLSKLFHEVGKMNQALLSIQHPDICLRSESNTIKSNVLISEGKIEFSNVSFKYNDSISAFETKSLLIEAGEKIGIVGYSGAGKSTFVNLLLGIYHPTKGKILIDDQDISSIPGDGINSFIGYVPQEPMLFQRSIRENIMYANPRSSHEDLVDAAKKAIAHDFIMKLPNGYDTVIGDDGARLSGGEKQRICIARAILGNFKIIVLDESTSQLDLITEKQVNESMVSIVKNKTVITIAHRLCNIVKMDRILVFDKGRIIASGTHDYLIDNCILYKELWNIQAHNGVRI
ncbi:ABC transporter ATP-binding protein [Candidatus Gromoviella agglomerans]|uniref:ABC transporter ATP-binding protein n=1 Tax=Candidatus Gromoviella agglomerans TaxID=2806609 RepID=UPI001E486F43|nr:ABC transporter ATP-binding protein [Candidatus Gromoviella agglomerans]UFX98430.1 ABC transporter ATP-binding/permease protein [Candidatus Gromoviella agglomerans]